MCMHLSRAQHDSGSTVRHPLEMSLCQHQGFVSSITKQRKHDTLTFRSHTGHNRSTKTQNLLHVHCAYLRMATNNVTTFGTVPPPDASILPIKKNQYTGYLKT